MDVWQMYFWTISQDLDPVPIEENNNQGLVGCLPATRETLETHLQSLRSSPRPPQSSDRFLPGTSWVGYQPIPNGVPFPCQHVVENCRWFSLRSWGANKKSNVTTWPSCQKHGGGASLSWGSFPSITKNWNFGTWSGIETETRHGQTNHQKKSSRNKVQVLKLFHMVSHCVFVRSVICSTSFLEHKIYNIYYNI